MSECVGVQIQSFILGITESLISLASSIRLFPTENVDNLSDFFRVIIVELLLAVNWIVHAGGSLISTEVVTIVLSLDSNQGPQNPLVQENLLNDDCRRLH